MLLDTIVDINSNISYDLIFRNF